jgi:hypothetical protein
MKCWNKTKATQEGGYLMSELTKKDPLTGEPFTPKRVNQRFASASNRKKYNNLYANALRKKRAIIYGPLNKNHHLLMKLMEGKNKSVFSYAFLEGYGIQFNSYSHTMNIDGDRYNCIFEFIIMIDGINNKVTIKRYGGF